MPRQPAGPAAALCAALTACAVLSAGASATADTHPVAFEKSHVRTTDARAGAAVAYGIERSATFRGLVDAIERSDLIVYITAQFDMMFPLDGEIHFVTSVGENRYMRILVRGELSPWDRCAMIAHELQHAREVADATWVRDRASLDALYHEIGFSIGTDRHETDAARDVAIRVTQELSPGWTPPAGR